MTPILTILVPVYNAERHLDAFLEQIDRQANPDMELVLVDDASTDRSAALLSAFAETTPWDCQTILLTHNSGAGGARQAGFAVARGRHLLCLDVDDELAPNALQTVADHLSMCEPHTVLVFDNFIQLGDNRAIEHGMRANRLNDSTSALEALLRGELTPYMWNKVIPTERLDASHFSPRRSGEDAASLARILQVYGNVQRVAVPIVTYVINTSSLSWTGDLVEFTSPAVGQLTEMRQALESMPAHGPLQVALLRQYAPRVLGKAAVAAARRSDGIFSEVRANVIHQLSVSDLVAGVRNGDRLWCTMLLALRIGPVFVAIARRVGYGGRLSRAS